MRRAVLLRSVQKALGDDVEVYDAAYMWARHRWSTIFAGVVLAALVLLAPVFGIDDWPTRAVIGLAGMGVAILASTDYRVTAETSRGLYVMRASSIRQVATGVEERLSADVGLERVGGTILAADWQVGKRRYTVSRSSEQAMQRMAERRAGKT